MDLKKLEGIGAFIKEGTVEKTVSFKIGDQEHTATVFIRRMSVGEYERMFADRNANKGQFGHSAHLISAAVGFGEGGKEILPPDRAFRLHRNLANALLQAVDEVNGGKN